MNRAGVDMVISYISSLSFLECSKALCRNYQILWSPSNRIMENRVDGALQFILFVCIGVTRQRSGVPPGSSARSCSRQARGRSGFKPLSVLGQQRNRHSLYPLYHRHSGALQFIEERFIL